MWPSTSQETEGIAVSNERKIVVHSCGRDRETDLRACACKRAKRLTTGAANELVARGGARWWKRKNVNGCLVEDHAAVVLVAVGYDAAKLDADEFHPARTISFGDIRSAYVDGNDDAQIRIDTYGEMKSEVNNDRPAGKS
jgi:hypothetical protein